MRAVILVLALSQFVPTAALTSQQQRRVDRGARVRLTAPRVGLHKSVGTYVSVTDGSMQFEPEGAIGPWTIPVPSITELEVSWGRRSGIRKGAFLGGVVGAGLGVLVGAMVGHARCYQGEQCANPVGAMAGGALIGVAAFGAGGLVIGTVAGALNETDTWHTASLGQLELGEPPRASRRLDVGLLLSF